MYIFRCFLKRKRRKKILETEISLPFLTIVCVIHNTYNTVKNHILLPQHNTANGGQNKLLLPLEKQYIVSAYCYVCLKQKKEKKTIKQLHFKVNMRPFHRPEPLDVLLPGPLQHLCCPLSHSGHGGGIWAALRSAGCTAQS